MTSAVDEKLIFTQKEFRWLLVDIRDSNPPVRVRFRMVKGGWQSGYHKLSHVTDTSVVLLDERQNQLCVINIKDIIQFSVSERFNELRRHGHYDLLPQA